VLLKVPTKFQLVNSSPSLNNNLLIAFKPASVVVVVGKHVLSLTTKATMHILKMLTLHTLLLMELAPTIKPKHLKLTLQPSPRLQQTQLPPSNKLLHNNPSQFQSKPTPLISKPTHPVSSPAPHAVQLLTTQFSLLVMVPQTEPTIGSLKTHGVLHGVKLVILTSLPSTESASAVFNQAHSTQLFDQN
jgi:hypothetical protein